MSEEFEVERMLDEPFKRKVSDRHRKEYDTDGDSSEAYEYDGDRERRHRRKTSHGEKKKKKKHKKESRTLRHVDDSDRDCLDDEEMVERERMKGRERERRKREAMNQHSHSDREGDSDGREPATGKRRRSRHREDAMSKFDSPPRRFSPPHLKRHRSPERDRSRERQFRHAVHRSKDRERSVGRERSRERYRGRERSISRDRIRTSRKRSPSPKLPELTPEERDLRTIFCMQLSTRLDKRSLMDFFSKVGKVREVHLIRDGKSHRSKGIAYIEFVEIASVSKAMSMSGTKLDGIPIIIQPSHGERNRSNMTITTATGKPGFMGPMKLYVGSLHYNITEEMLRDIFEPFGPIDELKIMRDHQTGRSAGYGFLQFKRGEDGKKALDQLNGFELAGRPMKLGSVADYQINQNSNLFDLDEVDKVGFGMSATGRVQLMAKLAEGTGLQIPQAAAKVLNMAPSSAMNQAALAAQAPPISTQCFVLSNMFGHNERKDDEWEKELKDDVIEECNKHGGVLHIHVDKNSKEGNVYVKCPSIAAAMSSVSALHGRFFAGRQITAGYVPLPNYHALFPEAMKSVGFVMPSNALKSSLPYSF